MAWYDQLVVKGYMVIQQLVGDVMELVNRYSYQHMGKSLLMANRQLFMVSSWFIKGWIYHDLKTRHHLGW